ncbi:ATP-binding protein [Hymenobacter monticola]|uniref:AAA family ATPase n=1 Tax=Hymenobacter monticola TaxID=1705399 RepID=A0ABY4B5M4_9BACT|nr:SbcC/MukB-like Walker B domain-containing protein [Hymenobacter monticola]UOE34437.1 AAA family ATPase [Hymenobacter monticola]
MLNLFDELTGPAGYRLRRLQAFNWGTFHEGSTQNDIWELKPDGENTLLTGANGSGKTTLVDGLLALLVPPTKRFFNQSSGAQKRTDRSEESYVEGHYGRTQGDEQQKSRVEQLRKRSDNPYSIILGVFANAQSLPVTLVQVRWFSSAGLQRRYLVAKAELNIAEHIQFSTSGQWVSQLKKKFPDRVVEEFDSFPRYADKFRQLFGMRSDKAQTLFNQTVGMKVLGDLDEFIRTNMLEESTAQAEFDKLLGNYQTLLTAYCALEKARAQLQLLQPVHELSAEYEQLRQTLQQLKAQQRLLEPWFAGHQVALWDDETARQHRELDQLIDQLGQQEKGHDATNEQRVALEVQVANNQVAQQIRDLSRDISDLTKTKNEKEKSLRGYNTLARGLGLVENPDAGTFAANVEQALALQREVRQTRQDLEQQKLDDYAHLKEQQKRHTEVQAEVDQLESSKGKITRRPAEIRQEILEAVGATEAEIPFLAEVVQVKPDERKVWNDALEKLLHSTGLSLLVPERLYSAVRAYVHEQRDLRGKVVFHRVERRAPPTVFQNDDSVWGKLDLNDKSEYAAWAEHHIASRFDHLCTEDAANFERADKALLPSGLVRNKNRHERDDSRRQDHILGWDNRELLRERTRQARDLSEAIAKAEAGLRRLSKEIAQAEDREKACANFLLAEHFSKIDWQADAFQIQALTDRRDALENDSTALKTMQEQLRTLKTELQKQADEIKATNQRITRTEDLLKRLRDERQAARQQLDSFDSANTAADLASLDEPTRELRGRLSYAQFAAQKEAFGQDMGRRVFRQDEQVRARAKEICEAMYRFLHPGPAVTAKFTDWESDNRELRPEIERLAEYVDRYEHIKNDNLAELETRFHDEFKRGVTKALSDFVTSLEQQHDLICETIGQINESLRGIPFNLNPDTYIQLEQTDSTEPLIHKFRHEQLRSWQPDYTVHGLASNQREIELAHFAEVIQPFILELRDQEKWRQYVTDVRNWSRFKAREKYRHDDTSKQVYESSGSLSGGEGAQLAYTVLGAAIAYQFGINRESGGHRSFRFIVIDEAFSKLDEDKSAYLLKLCASLGLQLMVVTPLTSLHLLEKDVRVIHWVTKAKQDKRRSVVRDIPIRVYQAEKEALLTAEASHD